MCSLTISYDTCVINVFSYYRMCSLTTECILQSVFYRFYGYPSYSMVREHIV